MPPGTQTRRITIKVDAPGVTAALKSISNSMGDVSKNTKSLADNINGLKNTFLGYISAIGLRQLASMSDEMQNLSNRIKIVSLASEDNNEIMAKLLQLADETKQSVGNVGEIYARLGSSLKAAGATSGTMLEITKELINSFRVAGSTGTETTATIIQLSQAFASGTLRGQELRSVMLQNATLAQLLRERFGKNLAKDAEAGLISITEVLKVLRKNQDAINDSAKTLTITFEQVFTKALNKVYEGLFKLNQQFGLSGLASEALDVVIERMGLFLAIVSVLALTRIPQLILSIEALGKAMFILAANNPLVAALIATGAIVLATNNSITDFVDKLRNLGAWFIQLKVWALEFAYVLQEKLVKAYTAIGLGSRIYTEGLKANMDDIIALRNIAEDLGKPTYRPSPLKPADDKGKSDREFASLLERLEKIQGAAGKIKKIKEVLGELNQSFLDGSIDVETYNRKIINFDFYKLDREFKEGKFNLDQYNESLLKLKEQNLNTKLKEGVISLKQFQDGLSRVRADKLSQDLESGKISLIEFNQELVKTSNVFAPGSSFAAGASAYIESIGSVSQGVAGAIKNAFSSLENYLTDFIKTGEFSFAKFTQSILDDLTRIIVRASIVQPLANGLLSIGAGASGGAYLGNGEGLIDTSVIAGRGMAFDKGIQRFAKGGIVDSATSFGYGKGKAGLMGEAGPEAILPLSRGAGGNLGVSATVTPVTVNIINQSGSEVQQSERTGPNGEKTLDILITGKVREGIASGKYDKAMSNAYGLNRKGS